MLGIKKWLRYMNGLFSFLVFLLATISGVSNAIAAGMSNGAWSYTGSTSYHPTPWYACNRIGTKWQVPSEHLYSTRPHATSQTQVYCYTPSTGLVNGSAWYSSNNSVPCGYYYEPATYGCQRIPETTASCAEIGKYLDGGECVSECSNGRLGNTCLNPPPPAPQPCDLNNETYLGYGSSGGSICNTCESGMSAGIFNDSLMCYQNSENADQCSGLEIPIVKDDQIVCAIPDGTGEMLDENGNDLAGYEKDPSLNSPLADSEIDGLNNVVKNLDDNLDNIADLTSATNTRLGKIQDIADDTNVKIGEIKDLLESENTTEYDDSEPTIGQSFSSFNSRIKSAPAVAPILNIPTLSTSNTCPVYTIDAGEYGSHRMDAHCSIISDNRQILSAIFIAVWSLTALIVFLRS